MFVRVAFTHFERCLGDPSARVLAYDLIESVALDRNSARLLNEPHKLGDRQPARRSRAGRAIDGLVNDRPVNVVSTESKRDLRYLRRHPPPVGFHLRHVVEQEPRHGNRAKRIDSGWRGQVFHSISVWMKREWN